MNLIQNFALTNLFIAVIYLAYKAGFSSSGFFQANRIFLLAGTAAALILPWISPVLNFLSPENEISWMAAVPIAGEEFAQLTSGALVEPINSISPREWALWSYLAIMGTIAFLATALWLRMIFSTRKAPRHRYGKLRVIEISKDWSAFSIFHIVFYPRPFIPILPETRMILEHELVHARQWHSIDNIFLGLLRLAFFFNPFIHLLHRELMISHEYLADRLTSGSDRTGYSRILISHQFKVPHIVMMHPFNQQSFLKRRLNMLLKSNQDNPGAWKYLLLLPVFVGMVLGSSWSVTAQDQIDKKKQELTGKVEKELKKIGFEKTDDYTWKKDGITIKAYDDQKLEEINAKMKAAEEAKIRSIREADKQVFFIVEDMPTFQGGTIENFRNWVQTNVKYPEDAKTRKISGTEYVSFVVDTLGNMKNIQVVRSVDPLLSAEVIRVIKSAPAWTPGRQRGHLVNVSFSIPVKFVLDHSPVKKQEETTENANKPEDGEKLVFLVVEEMPVFEGGGIEKFINWTYANVKYPREAMEKSLAGTVEVSFVVNEKGQVEDVQIVKGADPVLDQAALDVVKSSPGWTPGKQRGHYVKVAFRFPIKFVLQ